MDGLRACTRFLDRVATVSGGESARYRDVLSRAAGVAGAIASSRKLEGFPSGEGRGPRVAILAEPGRAYVEAAWGTWLAGGIAVPLCPSHPPEELRYVLEDAQVAVVLATPSYEPKIAQLAREQGADLCSLEPREAAGEAAVALAEETARKARPDDGSLIIYTSGTTGRPKGALHTHRSLGAQVAALRTAWRWRADDRLLHCLPLHHIHGIVNALLCPLAAGACVEFLPKFSPAAVWASLQRREAPVSVFMGVPTMYSYLLSAYEGMAPEEQAAARAAAGRLRLTVSGSAACPVPTMQRWEQLSGQRLLERYGMTETGMVLSNPYEGERRPGSVGLPLPGVEVQLRGDGELAVRGDAVIREYWDRPQATAAAFDADGFFLTGDTAAQQGEPPYWRILGRTSTDIIKSGGFKLSALQVEDALLAHAGVAECAVLGLPHEALGEQIAAVVAASDSQLGEAELLAWAAERLPRYQVPHRLLLVPRIPRNAMGKVNKKALRGQLFPR